MSHELLCSWLELPATAWPPNHYALLGLPPGEGTTDLIEQRVLERMEKLRHYQLMHPEPVTDGMNLLAQAMICLTDPPSRRAYDRTLGISNTELEETPIPIEEIPPAPVIDVPPPPPRPTRPARLVDTATSTRVVPRPPPLNDPTPPKLKPALTEAPADAILIPELVDADPLPFPLDEEEAEIEPRPRLPERRPVHPREVRRKLYADAVRIRRVLRVWEQLRSFLDEPEKTFARRTETVAFMAHLATVRPLLPTVADMIGGTNQPGNLVAALSRQQLVVEMFRSLLPSQRDALARDCQQAHYLLLERYRDVRKEIQRRTSKNFTRRVWLPLGREIIARPEWLILLVGIIALVIAFVRSMPK